MATSNQNISTNLFYAPSLNLDANFSNFSGEKPELKNALNLSIEGFNGDGFWVTQEHSNVLCYKFPANYTLKGQVALNNDEYVLFFKTKTSNEIGVLKDCVYTKWVEAKCLNFENWITGVYKYNEVCESRSVYFSDGINPDRIINIDESYPKVITGYLPDDCNSPIYGTDLDCDAILANYKFKYPCVDLERISGNFGTGKYQVAIAYSEKGNIVSDYWISESILLHDAQGIKINIDNLDTSHKYFTLVLISQESTGQSLHIYNEYSTQTKVVTIQNYNNKETISFNDLFLSQNQYISSKHITVVNNQLLKAGLTTPIQIDYQQTANQIMSNWVSLRVPISEVHKYPCYLRDEVYSFAIQGIDKNGWIRFTSHIPNNTSAKNDTILPPSDDIWELEEECNPAEEVKYWQVYNTATVTESFDLECDITCEAVIARGEFGYFESTEKYPDDSSWGNLACKNILLHKFPDNCISPHYKVCDCNTEFVDVLGIEFNNITLPAEIVAYRILRADRHGNETILSKGLVSNMLKDEDTLFPNFPYNDLNPNIFLSKTQTDKAFLTNDEQDFTPFTEYSKQDFTYISPDIHYTLPLKGSELYFYSEQIGDIKAQFNQVYRHPKHQLLTNFSYLLAGVLGAAVGLASYQGQSCTETKKGEHIIDIGVLSSMAPGAVGPITFSTAAQGGVPAPSIQISIYSCDVTFQTGIPTSQYHFSGTCSFLNGGGLLTSVNGQTLVPPVPIVINNGLYSGTMASDNLTGLPAYQTGSFLVAQGTVAGLGVGGPVVTINETIENKCKGVSDWLSEQNIKVPGQKFLSSAVFAFEGIQNMIETIRAVLPLTQYAYQIDTAANFNNQVCSVVEKDRRRKIMTSDIVYPIKATIGSQRVNNDYREQTFYIKTHKDKNNPTVQDNSRFRMSDLSCTDHSYDFCELDKKASCFYTAVKRSNKNPYGQVDATNLIPISCWDYDLSFNTQPLFGGDTYISRFTYKHHFPLFKDFNFQQEDNIEIDYREYNYIGHARNWINSFKQSPLDLINANITNPIESKFNLDCKENLIFPTLDFKNIFLVQGKFYMSVNGVFNFFVESSYLNDFREKSKIPEEIHYPHQEIDLLHRHDRHKFDNKFLYPQHTRLVDINHSYFVSKYDPNFCADDFKIIYSKPSLIEELGDNWRLFPPLNYTQLSKKDGALCTIHSIDEYMLLISFEDMTYVTQPDDSLITDNGTQVFLGTGDIFSRRLKKLSNDKTGYTGSVDKFSFLNTRHGTTWVDRKRKKIFLYSGELKEISSEKCGMWFQEHLKTKSSQSHENSAKAVYDNHYDVIYYTSPEECPFTLSYKPGLGWRSFHSFIPIEYFSLSNNFLSANKEGIWKHNIFSKSYQEYYGTQYPYYFTYIQNNKGPAILQSLEIKNEVTDELNSYNQIYSNKLFFNKMTIYSEYSNSGEMELIVKEPNNRNQIFTQYKGKCLVSHTETNNWRINNFRNFATGQPHIQLLCDGFTTEFKNVDVNIDPRNAGTIRGDWFSITLKNDKIFNLRFKTFISNNTTDRIIN